MLARVPRPRGHTAGARQDIQRARVRAREVHVRQAGLQVGRGGRARQEAHPVAGGQPALQAQHALHLRATQYPRRALLRPAINCMLQPSKP